MTRIVIDPPQAHATAAFLGAHGLEIETMGLRIARTQLPEMPAGVAAEIAGTLGEVGSALTRIGVGLEADARELHARALMAELEEAIAGTDLTGLGSFLHDDGKWIGKGLSFFGAGGVLPVALASLNGYRIVPAGRYAIVKGQPFGGPGLLDRYIRTGRLPGTRYLATNPKVLRFTHLDAALQNTATEAFNVRDAAFWKAARKGSGPLALALTIGGDVYDFTAGDHRAQGLGSTDFAANAIVDTGLLAGGAAASTAAGTAATSILAGGAAGATAGSVAPVVGTAIGFGVGVGITFLFATEPGRQVRSQLVAGTKAGLDWAKDHPVTAARIAANPFAAPATLAFEYRDEIGGAAADAARGGAHELEKVGGSVVGGIGDGFRALGRLP